MYQKSFKEEVRMQFLSDSELEKLNDDDLKKHFLSVRSKINSGRRQGMETNVIKW